MMLNESKICDWLGKSAKQIYNAENKQFNNVPTFKMKAEPLDSEITTPQIK